MAVFKRFKVSAILCVVLWLCSSSTLASKSKDVLDNHQFLVIYSNSLIPSIPVDVRVSILNASSDVNVEASLIDELTRTNVASAQRVMNADQTGHIQIPTPFELSTRARYYVRVSGSGGLNFQTGSYIRYETKSLTILTQLDKTRYSGGQDVKFRSVLLLPNLKGYKGNVTFTIYDGHNNKIKVFPAQPAKDGVAEGSIQLGNEPAFGTWSVRTEAMGVVHTKTFVVKPYVLPKFSVNIEVDLNDTYLGINVTARYTFNSAVHGKVRIELYPETDSGVHQFPLIIETNAQINGTASFLVKIKSDIINHFGSYHSAIGVRALVTDSVSSITMVAEKNGVIPKAAYPYYTRPKETHISRFDNRNTFVPGMIFYTTLSLMKDNSIVKKSAKIAVSVRVTTYEVRLCLLNNPPTKWLEEMHNNLPQFYVDSDDTGLAPLNFMVPHNADKLELTISSEESRYDTFELHPLTRDSTPMLRVIPHMPHVKVGEDIGLSVRTSEQITGKLVIEVYARGIAVESSVMDVASTQSTSLTVQATEDMVPNVHIVVTHITTNNSFMYDYAVIQVNGSPFKNQVSVSFNATKLKPGSDIEMTMTADPNSTVYVLTEDQKNRLLGTSNDIFLYQINKSFKVKILTNNSVRDAVVGRDLHFLNAEGPFSNDVGHMSNSLKLDPVTKTTGYNITTTGKHRFQKRAIGTNPPTTFSPEVLQYNFDSIYGYTFMDDGIIVLPENNNILNRVMASESLSQHTNLPKELSNLHTTTYSYWWYHASTYAPGIIPTPAAGQTYAPGKFPTYLPDILPTPAPGGAAAAAQVIRSYFPETWIWEKFQIGPSGTLSLPLTVPDSMTSWVTSVFATNEQTGFGLDNIKPKITVKKDFFVTMDPPKLIVLGEEFLLQLSVFNYLDTEQMVHVIVNTTDAPSKVLESTFRVSAGDGHSTFFQIVPQNVGRMVIRASANIIQSANIATDIIEKEVVVKPDGVHKHTNEQHYVEVSQSLGSFNKTVPLLDPPNIVTGSKSIKLTITGDFMQNSIEGLDKLINMPFGCGEQTMLNFAPDIYVTNYLKTVGKLTSKIQDKALSFMQSGLQRELTYRHTDGSFSAFGNQDPSGSSWLTAFVLKCFKQAEGLLDIDSDVKNRGITWLLRHQKKDGSFSEPGRIIHTQMQAGTASGIKLTAFILISVLENMNNAKTTSVTKASAYLEQNLSQVTDVYTMAIVCYALAKSNSPSKTACFNKMESTANIAGDKMYWMAKTSIHNMGSVSRRGLSTRAPSADIEATSYCMLTYLVLGERQKAKPIVKWLVSQRNPNGGFQSTQDTIISLQALSEYASNSHSSSHVDFSANGGSFQHAYSVMSSNNDLLHMVEVPSSLTDLLIMANGEGNAVVDVSMSYYVTGMEDNHQIGVTAQIIAESLNSITVSTCIRWNGDEASGMIVAEVEMPTGFSYNEDLMNKFSLIKKHELIGQNVALYFDGILAHGEKCVLVTMDRTDPVVKSQACHITVYDYYEPTNQARTRYESGVLKKSTICDVCAECSFCKKTNVGLGQIGVGK